MGRPQYPSFFKAVLPQVMVDVFFKSATLGLLLVHFLYPLFQRLFVFWTTELGQDERSLFMALVTGTHLGTYVVVNGMFATFDATGMFKKFKIGRKPFMQPTTQLIMRTLMEASFNMVVVTPLASYFLYDVFKYFGMLAMDAPLPPYWRLFVSFALCDLFNQFMFFFFHSTFHGPAFYATFHKQHHTYRGTIGIAAEFAGPSETVLANQFPTVGGAILSATHPLVVAVWLMLRLRQTFEVHSGYYFNDCLLGRLGFLYPESAAFHDYHHTVNKGNFGYLLTDWLFGTMDDYVAMGLASGYVAKMAKDESASKQK